MAPVLGISLVHFLGHSRGYMTAFTKSTSLSLRRSSSCSDENSVSVVNELMQSAQLKPVDDFS